MASFGSTKKCTIIGKVLIFLSLSRIQ